MKHQYEVRFGEDRKSAHIATGEENVSMEFLFVLLAHHNAKIVQENTTYGGYIINQKFFIEWER